MSGYILFSSEMRAVIKAQHPDFSFGELSRLVGTEWRNLEATKKAEYEGKVPGNHIWTLSSMSSGSPRNIKLFLSFVVDSERAAKVAEQQERERAAQNSPRAGTPVGALMGVVPPPTPMGMLSHSMTPMAGNPSQVWWTHRAAIRSLTANTLISSAIFSQFFPFTKLPIFWCL